MARRAWTTALTLAMSIASVMPACTETANVSDVWMSLDEDGARRRKVFYTDSANVTCIAQIGVGRQDVTFEMLLRRVAEAPPGTDDFAPTNKVILAKEFHPAPTPDGPGKIALTMRPTRVDADGKLQEDTEAPFTAGSYVCEVFVDGKKAKQAAFNIEYAPCPTIQIQQQAPCLGFYTTGTECPAAGESGDPTPTCACTDRGWECDR